MTFEGKAKLFKSDTSYIELIALYLHLKIANIFDHIQDSSRLGLEKKKTDRIFWGSTGLLYKFLPTNLGVFKPTFYNFYRSQLR